MKLIATRTVVDTTRDANSGDMTRGEVFWGTVYGDATRTNVRKTGAFIIVRAFSAHWPVSLDTGVLYDSAYVRIHVGVVPTFKVEP